MTAVMIDDDRGGDANYGGGGFGDDGRISSRSNNYVDKLISRHTRWNAYRRGAIDGCNRLLWKPRNACCGRCLGEWLDCRGLLFQIEELQINAADQLGASFAYARAYICPQILDSTLREHGGSFGRVCCRRFGCRGSPPSPHSGSRKVPLATHYAFGLPKRQHEIHGMVNYSLIPARHRRVSE